MVLKRGSLGSAIQLSDKERGRERERVKEMERTREREGERE